ncbi:Extended synaptotagmin-2-B [Paragonimus heterotremus]|uniref:Extended synaptotagmin-2-B n=1 Tax=Paragonimus heterotremus TaxID=100268 RepID=A0A8J4TBH6_9TREM|nr:Extended synaptotagmin-2-B [Paragonimus heterotremus]
MTVNGSGDAKKPGILSYAVTYLKFFGSCISLWGIGYMQFSATWIALGTFGYFCIQLARNKRIQLTSSLKAIGQDEKAFILQNFSVSDLPSWVYFPDVERAEWFNKMIKRLWPYVSDYARNIILESVEPAIAAQLPSALKPFKFTTIDLGDTPPRVGGVKVYMEENIRRDEIVMDLDLMLYSDARIKVELGKVKAGVKEFELRGTLRVVLKPLISKVPFAGAVTVCFLDSPYLNFSLTDMGNVLGLPGLQQTLTTVIRNVVNQLIVLPNRLPVTLVDNIDVQRLKYPMPQGILRIHVMGARRLKAGDKNIVGEGSSDPYCVIRVGARTFKTAVIQKTLDPEWNEHFETVVDVQCGQFLEIEVYDKDQGNKDDALGTTAISLESVYELGELDTWTKLEGVKTGSIHLKLNWFVMSNQLEDVDTAMKQAVQYRSLSGTAMSAAFLYVVVKQAKNLKRLKQMREPSPFCTLLFGRDAQMTEVKEHTQSPTWESVHHFLVGDPYVDTLQIVVRDSRTETLLGNCSVPVKLLLTQQQLSVSRPFPLQESGPDGANIYLHLELKALVPGTKKSTSKTDGIVQGEVNSAEEPKDIVLDMEIRNRATKNANAGDSGMDTTWPRVPTPEADPNPSPIVATDDDEASIVSERQNLDSHASPNNPLGRLRLTVEYSVTSSLLSVTVHQASGLQGVDKDGLADPYVKVCLVDQHGTIQADKKTEPKKNNLNPVFEQTFEFGLSVDDLPIHGLRLDVKNHVGVFTRSGRTRSMGSAYVDLCNFLSVSTLTDWFTLVPMDSISMCERRSLSPSHRQ